MVSSLDYNAPWPVYALAWSNSSPSPTSTSSLTSRNSISSSTPTSLSNQDPSQRYLPPSSPSSGPPRRSDSSSLSTPTGLPSSSRLAIGSFLEEYSNRIQIIGPSTYLDKNGNKSHELKLLANADHPYPATKLAFQPSTLSDSNTTSGGSGGLSHSNSTGGRSYVSPTSKFAKRTSWGVGASGGGGGVSPNVNPINLSSEEVDYYPDRELLASTADCLRIWEIHRQDHNSEEGEGKDRNSTYVGKSKADGLPFALREKSVLAHSKSSASPPAPLTSFSWNAPSPNLIVTASIDTTCTIWDLPTRTALTQLIAHDREVYDVDWCPGSSDVFASVGADGSVRVFDLRSLEHSTIIYEMASTSSGGNGGAEYAGQSSSTASGGLAIPLLRIAFNPWDANYLATFHLESQAIQILDVRAPGAPILELKGHEGAVNAVAWGPPGSNGGSGFSNGGGGGPSKGMVATGGDDNQCLVYDLATSTLRTASAQGRRSRNSNHNGGRDSTSNSTNPSPAPSSNYSTNTTSPNPNSMGNSRIGVENPILSASLPDMVNNVSWLRLNKDGNGSGSAHGNHNGSGSYGERRDSRERNSVVQEWDEYNGGGNGNKDEERDWLAMVSGSLVRAMRV